MQLSFFGLAIVLGYLIIRKKNFFFGFKESFLLGYFFYIFLPIVVIVYYEDFLIDNFRLFKGYNKLDLYEVYFLSIASLVSFLTGYTFQKKKIRFINLKDDFYPSEIIFVLILFLIPTFINVDHSNPTIIIYILSSLLIYKSNFNDFKKITFLIIFLLLIQYWTVYFSGSRRDIIKLLIIFLFFLRLIISSNRKFLFLLCLFSLVSLIFVFLNTYNRSNLEWDFKISAVEFIANYDFMPTFDNFMYILKGDEYLFGQSLFKILFAWIPREVWPSKPFDTNLLIIQKHYNVFVGGSSQGVGLLGELYWNFSWFGILGGSFILGVLAKNFDLSRYEKLKDSQIIILSSLSYLIFVMWRGSITTTIIIYLKNIVALFLLFYLVKLIFRKKYKRL